MYGVFRGALIGILAVAALRPIQTQAQDQAIQFAQISPDLAKYGAVDWDARWDRPQISVCWLNHPEFAVERAWVRDQVAKTWEAASGIRFTGWQDCKPGGADVRIFVDESGPRAYVGL